MNVNTKTILFGMALCMGFITACNDSQPNAPAGECESPTVVGHWNWVRSYGGFAGNGDYTPANTNVERTMTFDTHDTVTITDNGVVVQKTSYYLSRELSILVPDSFDMVTINYQFYAGDSLVILPMRHVIREACDTLLIEEDVFDGLSHVFSRIP